MNSRDERHGWLPWAVGTAASLFYLCYHSTFYNFDGVACAIAVELADLPHLAHGNHLAYGIVGLAWTQAWRAFGYAGAALLSLQALDSLLGGIGAGLFCRLLLRRLRLAPAAAAAASAGLALSYAWWFWSLEAQVYMLAAVFLVLAADAALAEEPAPLRVGFWHGLAMLGHVGHAMFFFCAAFLLWRRKRRARPLALYSGAATATVLAAYAAAALFCVKPADWEAWRAWLLGSAALSRDRSFAWLGGTMAENCLAWLMMFPRVFTDPAGLAQPGQGLGWLLAAAALAAAAWGARTLSRPAKACLIWLAGYALLFTSWQPATMVYRTTDLVPLWLLIALAASSFPGRAAGPALLAAWACAIGLFNHRFLIEPQTDPARNAEYQDALWVGAATPPDAWVVATARGQVYVPYFAHRRPLNLRYWDLGREKALAERLDAMDGAGSSVFATSRALRESGWEVFFRGYGLREEGRASGEVLYRVKRKGKPKGSR